MFGLGYVLEIDFSGGFSGKETPANAGDIRDVGSIPGLGRTHKGGRGNPLQKQINKT